MASLLKGIGPRLSYSYLKNRPTITATHGMNVSRKSLSTTASILSDSDSKKSEEDHQVVMTNDGRVIVCWHPEVPFPYELTKPVPAEAASTDQVLKVQALRPVREIFRPKHQRTVVHELMNLTYTPKYSWYPKERRQRYKEMNPLNEKRDREGL